MLPIYCSNIPKSFTIIFVIVNRFTQLFNFKWKEKLLMSSLIISGCRREFCSLLLVFIPSKNDAISVGQYLETYIGDTGNTDTFVSYWYRQKNFP